MDDNLNTNSFDTGPTQSPSFTPLQKKGKAGRVLLWIFLLLLLLAAGLGGGYFYGQMNKQQEIDAAKAQATTDAQEAAKKNQNSNTSSNNSNAQASTAPAKTATETTCNADELSLTTTASSSGSGAGTLAYDLILTNTGKRTCILGGFPGVSLVNDNGNMIGSPADRAKNYEEKKLTLAPNTKVKATLSTANPANFSDGQCKSGATKLRVYPPNDTGYLSATSPVTSWCPGMMTSPVLGM